MVEPAAAAAAASAETVPKIYSRVDNAAESKYSGAVSFYWSNISPGGARNTLFPVDKATRRYGARASIWYARGDLSHACTSYRKSRVKRRGVPSLTRR